MPRRKRLTWGIAMNPLLKRLASLRRKVRFLDGWLGVCALVALVLGVVVAEGLLDFSLHLPSLVRAILLGFGVNQEECGCVRVLDSVFYGDEHRPLVEAGHHVLNDRRPETRVRSISLSRHGHPRDFGPGLV